jgi:hypothetical protein
MPQRPRKPHRLTHLAQPRLTGDAKFLAVTVMTATHKPVDLEIPVSEIGGLVEFLIRCADYLISQAENDEVDITPDRAKFAPIPLRRIHWATGSSTTETLLVIEMAGFDLAFSMNSQRLSEFADGLIRTARTLSAGSGKPQ